MRGEGVRWKFRMLWRDKAQFKESTLLRPSFVRDSGLSVIVNYCRLLYVSK